MENPVEQPQQPQRTLVDRAEALFDVFALTGLDALDRALVLALAAGMAAERAQRNDTELHSARMAGVAVQRRGGAAAVRGG